MVSSLLLPFVVAVLGFFAGSVFAQPFSPDQCAGFLLLGFDFASYDQYPVWFDENSTMTLAQAGAYQGPESIEEYVKFANEDSPYVSTAVEVNATANVVGFDPVSGTCIFLVFSLSEYDLDPTTTPGYSLNIAVMAKFLYSIPKNMIDSVNIYYTPEFLTFFFETALGTQITREYVCDVLASTGCDDIYTLNGSPSRNDCVGDLQALDVVEGEFGYFDGKSQGCRSLHATFAQENPNHCAHISFAPAQDPQGDIKCQTSTEIPVSSLFAAAEEAAFGQFCAEQAALDFTTECFLVTEDPTTETPIASPTASPSEETSDPTTETPIASPTTSPSEETSGTREHRSWWSLFILSVILVMSSCT